MDTLSLFSHKLPKNQQEVNRPLLACHITLAPVTKLATGDMPIEMVGVPVVCCFSSMETGD